jgi:phosphate uptake regulator
MSRLSFAIRAVEEENLELAGTVIELDKKVNKFDVKIDKICQKIFALSQPVAMDLRYIMSSLTINSNLERIGDIAVNISENILLIQKKPAFYNQTKDCRNVHRLSSRCLRTPSIHSLVRMLSLQRR